MEAYDYSEDKLRNSADSSSDTDTDIAIELHADICKADDVCIALNNLIIDYVIPKMESFISISMMSHIN